MATVGYRTRRATVDPLSPSTERRRPAEVWLSEPHDPLREWHLLDGVHGIQGVSRCGRSARLISSAIWPVRPGEPGPPPAQVCPECSDLIVREEGRLPNA